MHFAIRGLLEQHLDERLMEQEMRNACEVISSLDLQVSSQTDTEIGFFLGNAFSQMKTIYTSLYSREPTPEETQEFIAIIKRRVAEIKAKTSVPEETSLRTVHEIKTETPSDEKFSFSSNQNTTKTGKKKTVAITVREDGKVEESISPEAENKGSKEKKKKKKAKSWI